MNPFLGEIRLFPWNWAPRGWFLCEGQLLAINQYAALFSLLGTQYGGNGTSTFALPDLRSRVPIHFGSTYVQGEMYGVEQVSLNLSEMPMHPHTLMGLGSAGGTTLPNGNAFSNVANVADPHYAADSPCKCSTR